MPGSKPYLLTYVMQHPLSRMLPLFRYQAQVYRMGERLPPSALEQHSPMWEVAEFNLDPLATLQARINLQRDFTLLALGGVCTVNTNGGFRLQFYDLKKRYRFADRAINFANIAGAAALPTFSSPPPGAVNGPAITFLREPYRFPVPDSQILMEVQNFESVANTVQVLYYGQVMRFNAPGLTYPGGPETGWDWGDSVEQYMHLHHPGRHRER